MPTPVEEFSASRAIAWQKIEAGWSGSVADLRSLKSRFTSTYSVLHDLFFEIYGDRDKRKFVARYYHSGLLQGVLLCNQPPERVEIAKQEMRTRPKALKVKAG